MINKIIAVGTHVNEDEITEKYVILIFLIERTYVIALTRSNIFII